MNQMGRVFAQSYDCRDFHAGPAWREVERHIHSRGVCAGVGGARGSGKTWLLRNAVREVSDNGGVGVYFPSPSAYDASAFLSGLCLALATESERRLRPRSFALTALLEIVNKRGVQIAAVAVILATAAYFLSGSDWQFTVLYMMLALFSAYLYISLIAILRRRQLKRNPERALYLKSLAVMQWIQYSAASKTSNEISLEGGKGIVARGKTSEELALSERPVTELTLVMEFRSLAESLARGRDGRGSAVANLSSFDRSAAKIANDGVAPHAKALGSIGLGNH